MEKRNPPPWKFDGDDLKGSDGSLVLKDQPPEILARNRRLVEAAPEMFDLLNINAAATGSYWGGEILSLLRRILTG